MKLKKDDTVLIISGKDKGKKGKIIKSFPKEGKILVEGVNLKRKNQKPKKQGEKGQILEIAKPFTTSNAMLICSKCGKSTRVGHKIAEGKKYRICKKCNQEI